MTSNCRKGIWGFSSGSSGGSPPPQHQGVPREDVHPGGKTAPVRMAVGPDAGVRRECTRHGGGGGGCRPRCPSRGSLPSSTLDPEGEAGWFYSARFAASKHCVRRGGRRQDSGDLFRAPHSTSCQPSIRRGIPAGGRRWGLAPRISPGAPPASRSDSQHRTSAATPTCDPPQGDPGDERQDGPASGTDRVAPGDLPLQALHVLDRPWRRGNAGVGVTPAPTGRRAPGPIGRGNRGAGTQGERGVTEYLSTSPPPRPSRSHPPAPSPSASEPRPAPGSRGAWWGRGSRPGWWSVR